MSNPTPHRTLGAITKQGDGLKAISKAALLFGEQVLVTDADHSLEPFVMTRRELVGILVPVVAATIEGPLGIGHWSGGSQSFRFGPRSVVG